MCITVVTVWLTVYTTIWETVYMFKYINTLGISWVELIKSVKEFPVSSDIVLKIELKELKFKVLNTLLKVFTNFSTLLSKTKASINI